MEVKARIKTEDVDAIVRKKLSINDLRSVFNEEWYEGLFEPSQYGRPASGFTPESRKEAFSDFAELFRDKYMETGDVSVAKEQAAQQMTGCIGRAQPDFALPEHESDDRAESEQAAEEDELSGRECLRHTLDDGVHADECKYR